VEELRSLLSNAGFTDILIEDKDNSDDIIKSWNFGEGTEKMVFSAYIQAKKPLGSLVIIPTVFSLLQRSQASFLPSPGYSLLCHPPDAVILLVKDRIWTVTSGLIFLSWA